MKTALALIAALLAGESLAASDQAEKIDLSHWKLTVPVEIEGGKGGKAADLGPEQLKDYASKWFHRAPDGGLVFFAPVGGATTEHAKYARSELRERLDPTSDRVNWTMDDHALLTARLKVLQVPDLNGKIVVGQIHGLAASPMIKLVYANKGKDGSGLLYGITTVQPKPDGDREDETSEKCTVLSNLPLGQTFSYSIRVADGVLTYAAVGGNTCTVKLDPTWKGVGLYFKAGAYLGAKEGAGNGEVEFYQLTAAH